MDLHSLLAFAAQYLPPQYIHKAAEVFGWLSLVGQLTPKLLAWGVPAAVRGADWLSNLLLNSPAKPLVLWAWEQFHVDTLLDDLNGALKQILDTFKNRLEADIDKASATSAPLTLTVVKTDDKTTTQ